MQKFASLAASLQSVMLLPSHTVILITTNYCHYRRRDRGRDDCCPCRFCLDCRCVKQPTFCLYVTGRVMLASEAGSEGNASFAGGAEWRKQTYAGLSDPRPSLKWEFPKIRGTLFWGPYNKDPTI